MEARPLPQISWKRWTEHMFHQLSTFSSKWWLLSLAIASSKRSCPIWIWRPIHNVSPSDVWPTTICPISSQHSRLPKHLSWKFYHGKPKSHFTLGMVCTTVTCSIFVKVHNNPHSPRREDLSTTIIDLGSLRTDLQIQPPIIGSHQPTEKSRIDDQGWSSLPHTRAQNSILIKTNKMMMYTTTPC